MDYFASEFTTNFYHSLSSFLRGFEAGLFPGPFYRK
jgi:hypothetical protein